MDHSESLQEAGSRMPGGGDPPAEPKTPEAIPPLNLPKGGGAIRGMGEKFTVNAATGTGSLRVPIFTSAGRSGVSPDFALTYDSGSGNGPFGFGWSLSLPSVTRKTDKGLPEYNDVCESDIFILAGAEDLTPYLVERDDQWVRDVTPERWAWGRRYSIHRYRPRVEEAYSRIERWSDLDDPAETFWRSISRENVSIWYGRTRESRIADPQRPEHIFSWLMSYSHDDKGNVIAYDYKAENSQNVPLDQANERNRTDLTRSANRYVKRVRYGNRTPFLPGFEDADEDALPRDWCFELVFDYGDHDPGHPTPEETRPWDCRTDPFSTYRSTFEIRTYRLCRRALMFHHFPNESGVGADCLVRATALEHARPDRQTGLRSASYAYLLSAQQTGYSRDGSGYAQGALPPLEFEYSQAEVDETVRQLDPGDLENLPSGLDSQTYRWVDLDGEGSCGILTEQAGSWFYKPNWSAANDHESGGKRETRPRFGPMLPVAESPTLAALGGGRQQLLDLSGDGRMSLVDFAGTALGYFERTPEGGWTPFRPFRSLPVVDWADPELKFVDLTGDGFADLLINEGDRFRWHPSLSTEGFGEAFDVSQAALEEETGPRLVFADGTESVFLADLSGDGLTDLVRIRQGEVCYWPNLGFGSFGPKITMDSGPLFDTVDLFNPARVLLADIDGSGTADIVYVGADSVRLYFNQSGNAWSEPRVLRHFPVVSNVAAATAIDLLGNGTACLVWSSPLPSDAQSPLRYIDLMGGQKPHLLVRARDNMGSETAVTYAPSTKFYVADKLAGTPWLTRLPFPVHVVEEEQTFDFISRNLFVSRYDYHHGYYDGVEREFRGFGRVDRRDTADYATLSAAASMPAPTNVDAASNAPPVWTKIWFHTGAYFGEGRVSKHLEHEYYQEGAAENVRDEHRHAMLLPDTLLPSGVINADGSHQPHDFSPEEFREACRALRGSILRQEVYALDGSEAASRPYAVSERNYAIEAYQPQGPNRYAAFVAHPREVIDFHYDRKLFSRDDVSILDAAAATVADPRVNHSFTLKVDPFGNVLQSASIAYGRRYADPSLAPLDQARQSNILSTCTEADYTNPVDLEDAYRHPLPAETRTFELLQIRPRSQLPSVTNLFRFDELSGLIKAAGDGSHDLPYEDDRPDGLEPERPYRRLTNAVRTRYRPDDMGEAAGNPIVLLPLGRLEPLALMGDTYKLAFTPGLIAQTYRRDGAHLLTPEAEVFGATEEDGGGYVDLDRDGHWWIPAGRVFYAPSTTSSFEERRQARSHFYQLRRHEDPFGNPVRADYDPYDLLVVRRTDAAGNEVQAGNDYRVLAPSLLTDPNGNRSAICFDPLALVIATAVQGKSGEDQGDLLSDFPIVLGRSQIDAFYDARDPHDVAPSLLGDATTRVVYDVRRFFHSRQAAPDDPSKWQPAFSATLRRETHHFDLEPGQQSKIQISVLYTDGFGREIQRKIQAEPGPVREGGPIADPRWVGSGWTIFNNKGKPVRQYEPFFSQLPSRGHQFEFGVRAGVSPILCYDPVDRVVATIRPNHSFEKVVFDPWRKASWDLNDTVLQIDPAADPDVGGYIARLARDDYVPTWYGQRIDGALGALEQTAARRAAAHAGTPALEYYDVLGRNILSIADNGPEGRYATRYAIDILGRQRSITDALDRTAATYDYTPTGVVIRTASMDAGERWILQAASGETIRSWDSRGHAFRMAFDGLRRPMKKFVEGSDPRHSDPRTLHGEVLYEHTEYGEGHARAKALNLRSRPFRLFDGAGVVTNLARDPESGRDVAFDFKGNPLRATRQFASNPEALPNWSGPSPELLPEVFVSAHSFDAINRIVTSTTPDGSVARPVYNAANLLDQLSVQVRGAAEATDFITNIEYDAHGHRVLIEYGNSASTTYSYDPFTFRPVRHTTVRREGPPDAHTLQQLSYVYDPVGNISHIHDGADIHDTIFFRNRRVDPDSNYVYDATYRLTTATGREHLSVSDGRKAATPTSSTDAPRVHLTSPGDGNAMGRYYEQYLYDAAGNFQQLLHRSCDAGIPGWTRTYGYQEASLIEPHKVGNRLSHTALGGDPGQTDPYRYDPHGEMTSMPQLQAMQWDFNGHLLMTQRQAVGADDEGHARPGERTYYVYNADGERVRKATVSGSDAVRNERFYLSGYELYRKYRAGAIRLESQTLHVMDDKRRVALVHTTVIEDGTALRQPVPALRYQLDNHLGSATLELDERAAVITYEEYYPFGGTSYQGGISIADTSLKRYRYTDKERDDESGLYYNVARYYMPWTGIWISTDPAGVKGGVNLYQYARSNPIALVDPAGTQPAPFVDPEAVLTVAQSALARASAAWGTDAAIYLTGASTAAAPAAVAAAPAALAGESTVVAAEPAIVAAAEGAPVVAEGVGVGAELSGAAGGTVVGSSLAFAGAAFLTLQLHMQRSGSIARYGNPWGVSSGDAAFPVLRAQRDLQERQRPAPRPVPQPKPKPDEDEKTLRLGRIYVTYTKYNKKTKLTYSGRTSMVVDLDKPLDLQADAAVALRDANHHIDENDEPKNPDFEGARRDKFAVGSAIKYDDRYKDPAYLAIRGREQQLIDHNGGAYSDTKPKRKSENAIRGYAKDAKFGRTFHNAANLFFGQLHEYTGTRKQ